MSWENRSRCLDPGYEEMELDCFVSCDDSMANGDLKGNGALPYI